MELIRNIILGIIGISLLILSYKVNNSEIENIELLKNIISKTEMYYSYK